MSVESTDHLLDRAGLQFDSEKEKEAFMSVVASHRLDDIEFTLYDLQVLKAVSDGRITEDEMIKNAIYGTEIDM